jgi:hypothetical protein
MHPNLMNFAALSYLVSGQNNNNGGQRNRGMSSESLPQLDGTNHPKNLLSSP